jgi:hypothetical protein
MRGRDEECLWWENEKERTTKKLRRGWEGNIKMYLKEIG